MIDVVIAVGYILSFGSLSWRPADCQLDSKEDELHQMHGLPRSFPRKIRREFRFIFYFLNIYPFFAFNYVGICFCIAMDSRLIVWDD
jgi:hypothetical protein